MIGNLEVLRRRVFFAMSGGYSQALRFPTVALVAGVRKWVMSDNRYSVCRMKGRSFRKFPLTLPSRKAASPPRNKKSRLQGSPPKPRRSKSRDASGPLTAPAHVDQPDAVIIFPISIVETGP